MAEAGPRYYVEGIETINGLKVTNQPMGVWSGLEEKTACELANEMIARGWCSVSVRHWVDDVETRKCFD